MVQTFLQPAVLKDAMPQAVANVLWVLAELCRLPGWQGGVSEQDMQQLLGKRQLQLLAADDGCQPTSNVLVGLANMVTGPAPLVATAFARDCGQQLLTLTGDRLLKTNAQHITNAIWACGELKLAETPFVAAAPKWLPQSTSLDLTQVGLACAALPCQDEGFVQDVMQHMEALLKLQEGGHRRGMRQVAARAAGSTTVARASAAVAACCFAVTELNILQLADTAKSLVVSIGRQQLNHPADMRRLWVFHSWLVEGQLLDGRGLAGVLTQQQLQKGAHEAASFGK